MATKRLLVYEDLYHKYINDCNKKFLGSWCLPNWQCDFSDVKKDDWADKDILITDIEYIKDFTLRILESTYKELNNNNLFIDLSFDKFSLIYYSWTFNIIVKVYSNWKLFDDKTGADTSYVFDIKYDEVIVNNLLDANMTYYYPKWNLFIISQIIKFQKIENQEFSYIEELPKTSTSKLRTSIIKIRKCLLFVKYFLKFGFKINSWTFYYFTSQNNLLPQYQKSDSITQYVQLIYDIYKAKVGTIAIDNKLREGLKLKFNSTIKFELFMADIFFKLVPISLLEGFYLLKQYSILSYTGSKPSKLVYSDFLNNELLLYNLLSYDKSQVYVYQHGGGFGFNNYNIIEIIEKYYCRKYLTWGWKNSEIDLPFISPNFNQIFKIGKNLNRRGICFILYDSPPFIPTFQPTIFSSGFSNYLKNLNDFFYHTNLRNIISLRLYPRNDSKINFNSYFPEDLNIDISRSIKDLYSKYELYVYTYNSTGFLELWSLNLPCVLFVSCENWFVDEFGINIFQILVENNLLFTNGNSLEYFLKCNFHKINFWWNLNITRNAVSSFLDIYARKSNSKFEESMYLNEIFNV